MRGGKKMPRMCIKTDSKSEEQRRERERKRIRARDASLSRKQNMRLRKSRLFFLSHSCVYHAGAAVSSDRESQQRVFFACRDD